MKRHPFTDLIVLFALLAGANYLWARGDAGWLKLNPTPWLILPLTLGSRWGFKWGLAGGLIPTVIALVAKWLEGVRPDEILAHHAFFLVSGPVAGVLAGEISGLLNRRHDAAAARLAELETAHHDLADRASLVDESRQLLQQRLALVGAEACSLDQQLRGLFVPGAPPLFAGLLRVLRDAAGLTEAAFFTVGAGGTLARVQTLGAPDHFPAQMRLADLEIASVAVQQRTITTCRSLWKAGAPEKAGTAPLAAVPWLNAAGQPVAVLVISRMVFTAVNWRTFSRIDLICRWAARFEQTRGPSDGPLVSPVELGSHVALAQEAAREHQLPSAVVDFACADAAVSGETFLRVLAPLLHPTAVAALAQGAGGPHLRVLLPLEGRREAEALIRSAGQVVAREAGLAGRVTSTVEIIGAETAPA